MPIRVTCRCGSSFNAKDEHAGLSAKCPKCGQLIEIPFPAHSENALLNRDEAGLDQASRHLVQLEEIKDLIASLVQRLCDKFESSPDSDVVRRPQYKVLTQKDKWFSGKFDPDRLEQAINAYADQGWVVKGVATAAIPGFGGNREELIVIMERY